MKQCTKHALAGVKVNNIKRICSVMMAKGRQTPYFYRSLSLWSYRSYSYSCLLLVSVLALFALLFLVLEKTELFHFVLSKAFIAAASRTISSLLIKMGLSGGLALAVAWSLKFFIFESSSCNMMAPSGASGSGSGEGGAGGRGFRWTDLFGSSSTGNSETSVNQPVSEAASVTQPNPTSPNPGEPAAPEAEVYHPLQEERQRRLELKTRLDSNTLGRPLPEDIYESIIETQFQTELRIEKALRSDRVSDDSIVSKRHQIRGVLFYPNGKALSLDTYLKHLHQMEWGTHRSLPYRRLMDAISNLDLFLDKEGIKKVRFR